MRLITLPDHMDRTARACAKPHRHRQAPSPADTLTSGKWVIPVRAGKLMRSTLVAP